VRIVSLIGCDAGGWSVGLTELGLNGADVVQAPASLQHAWAQHVVGVQKCIDDRKRQVALIIVNTVTRWSLFHIVAPIPGAPPRSPPPQ
jgi:hypothetical protein